MRTQATMFSGGEGFGEGARAAGLRHLWGLEAEPDIAAVAELNDYRSIVARVQDVDYAALEAPYHLHASPVCKEYSDANADGAEGEEEIAQAQAICRAIIALRSHVFTLENVRAYARPQFKAFPMIVTTLHAEGYGVTWRVLNSADYGVPQTRERLILRAVRGQDRPLLPTPTHARADKIAPMLDDRLPWVGWYEAIRDLISTLPDSAFAPWQLARLPREIRESIMPSAINADGTTVPRRGYEPTFTLQATAYKHMPRAFILDGTPNPSGDATLRDGEDRIFTVTTGKGTRQPARAFLVPNDNTGQEWGRRYRDGDEPSPTHSAGRNYRAMLPVSGRVVRMTPRALARFQSFPDTYILPDKASLATTVIGNAVPPLLAQRLCEVPS